ncbi:DUF2059 domain-containing protein [Neorhizobium galegae]|uniref:DUF2059 domain-containing protein n=1 Tax=Neorhizobium galegae TaxID=399 RepID=UPI0006218048|nr:DUF2059 domain-containing protein [Neorhizobium galegae]CDZ30445.1 Hypothetical protein NGAL_HAMBI490_53140 [Neorhizobium galegae bv. officinalis]KAA9387127.1 DUF2059 domain-containing protein [Neorhizobium galegae]KAB1114273.1 DUF2059 domain-containing protein [Neorhizobium galegae]MCM2497376.1 DUF2059 domain-containing protein [Neorhizobium galegae]MCQ1771466.1 DUF2059 domain-containing protein [Neorhizobium galegae]
MIRFAVIGRAAAVAILFSGAFTVSVRAQEVSEAQLAAARDAITALNVTDRYDNILPNLAERLKAQFIQASPNFQGQISNVVDEQALVLAPRRADLEKEAATIYAKSFSVDELKSISTFFNTETGKKLLTTQPLVSRELTKAAEIWANGISRDLTNQSSEKLRGIIDANPIAAPVVDPAPAEAQAAAPVPAKPATPPAPAKPAAAPAAKPAAPAAAAPAKPAAPAVKPAPAPAPAPKP